MPKFRLKMLAAAVLPLVAASAFGEPVVSRTIPAPAPLNAASTLAAPNATDSGSSHQLQAADLENWLDGFFGAALEGGEVAGAVISVVKDGRVILSKGYGYADVAAKTPMSADRTLIRPGSVSKLFAWTAVMQLVEAGKLDLNADINTYLDFKIPETHGHPITLNDLMTHRAGFEEGLKDASVNDPRQLQPLGVFLKRHIRPEIFPPGEVPAYSNYGAALAGYIVQRVSGERFEDYVARHIFTPLGMNRSTFAQPLPRSLAPEMSRGYRSSADAPKPFELVTFSPAGGLTCTATDMANFMLAHLQDGRLGDGAILRPETERLMQTASLPHPSGFDAIAHGFFQEERNGRLVLEHGGDTILFHSDLELFPQEGLGVFVSFNSRGKDDAVYGIRDRFLSGFLNRYLPFTAPRLSPALSTAKAHGKEIAGRYETSRRVQTGFISLFYVLQSQQVVSLNRDATIHLSTSPDKAFREVAPYLWREIGGTRQLELTKVNGVKTIVDSHDAVGVLQAVPLKRDAGLNVPIFACSLLIAVAAALVWLFAGVSRRLYRRPSTITGAALLARRLANIAAVADLIYLLAWFMILRPIMSTEVSFYTSSLDPVIRALQIAVIIPVVGAAAGLWNAWLSMRSGRSRVAAAGGVLLALALIGIVWIAYVGGLADFTLNY